MYQDEIITEVWKNRDSYTAKHHHRLAEIVADLQVRQKKSGCRIVDRRGRRRASGRSSSAPSEA